MALYLRASQNNRNNSTVPPQTIGNLPPQAISSAPSDPSLHEHTISEGDMVEPVLCRQDSGDRQGKY